MAEEIKVLLNNKDEFAKFCKEGFDHVDKDHSGQIDEKELKGACDELAKELNIPGPEPDDVKKILQVIDHDSSGKISLAEFSIFMEALLSGIAENM